MTYEQYEASKQRLWSEVLRQVYGTTDLSTVTYVPPSELEAHAFFLLIDHAFGQNQKKSGYIPVERELVQYLAGWGRDVTRGYEQSGGPFDTPKHNHFIRRAYNAFYQTLRRAVQHGELRYFPEENRALYGNFVVPQWLIDQFMDELREQAEHDNSLWDESESWRDFFRRPDFLLE